MKTLVAFAALFGIAILLGGIMDFRAFESFRTDGGEQPRFSYSLWVFRAGIVTLLFYIAASVQQLAKESNHGKS